MIAFCACVETRPGPPDDLTLTPSRGRADRETPVELRGELLFARTFIDYSGGKPDRIARGASIALGGIPLEPLILREDGVVAAVVPKNFPVGVHDLEIVDPDGRLGIILRAFEVYLPGCDELGPQAPGCFSPCGDGVLDEDERCDDGNSSGGDGCSAACMIETGFTCVRVRHSRGTLCFDDARTRFVDGGSCTAIEAGTKTQPFCQLQSAIDAGAPATILVRSSEETHRAPLSFGGGEYRVYAEKESTIISPETGRAAVTIRGGDVLFHGFWIITSGDGIVVESGASARLLGNAIAGSSFGSAAGSGIIARAGSAVEIRGNLVEGNRRGGMAIETGDYRVESNVIAANGEMGSSFGGVLLAAAPIAGSRFAFNTVVANTSSPGGGAAGVECAAGGRVEATIVRGNGSGGIPSALGAGCAFESSAIDVAGEVREDPAFVSDDPEYHLELRSPLIDRAGEVAGAVDFDGDRRPRGTGGDIGADEAG